MPHAELVIDVCVFINAISPLHPAQRECVDFLYRAHAAERDTGLHVREPPLFVLEFFAARNRTSEGNGHDVSLYPEFQLTDTTTPLRTKIEPFTEEDAHQIMGALATAFPFNVPGEKRHPLVKGADLEFLAVARKHGCPLVTTDEGLLEYGRRGFAKVVRPCEWPAKA